MAAEAGPSICDQPRSPNGQHKSRAREPVPTNIHIEPIGSIWTPLEILSPALIGIGKRKGNNSGSAISDGCPSILSRGVFTLLNEIIVTSQLPITSIYKMRRQCVVDQVKGDKLRIPRTCGQRSKPQPSTGNTSRWSVLLTLTFAFIIPVGLAAQTETFVISNTDDNRLPGQQPKDFFLGPCLVNTNQTCPDEEITFFLYTVHNPFIGQQVFVDNASSNLAETNFVPSKPTKIVVHGYNSDMQLSSLVDIRDEYLKRGEYNVIHVDWHRLAIAPCYPIAVHNVPHVGDCLAQLINRLREYGSTDIHVIGFSLGAHVPAFAANVLRPYKLARITGLDPAMPLFVAVDKDEKLDAGDAEFVDVFHTNAFIQGQVEASGTIDFYMNGGVNQPGCWEKRNPFGCNHHRSAEYFAESINSKVGFWGWPCSGFVAYLLGLCPPRFPAVLAGDRVDKCYSGFHLVKTRAESPFAEGLFPVNLQDMHQ